MPDSPYTPGPFLHAERNSALRPNPRQDRHWPDSWVSYPSRNLRALSRLARSLRFQSTTQTPKSPLSWLTSSCNLGSIPMEIQANTRVALSPTRGEAMVAKGKSPPSPSSLSRPHLATLRSLPLLLLAAFLFSLHSSTALVSTDSPNLVNEAPHVSNPSTPLQGPLDFRLEERWRIDSEMPDGSLLFGAVSDVEWDSEGNIYFADYALETVHVFTPEGHHLRSLASKGEGPGEVLSVEDCFVTSQGVGIIEYNRQRITFLNYDGTVAGLWAPAGFGELRVRPLQAVQRDSLFIVACKMLEPLGDRAILHEFLGQFSSAGQLLFQYLEFPHELARDRPFTFDEELIDGQQYFVATAQGEVFASPSYLKYLLLHFDIDGRLTKTFGRTYEHVRRSAAQVQDIQSLLQAEHVNYRNAVCVASPYERDILRLNMKDNYLWIETSQGWFMSPAGTALTMDIFDMNGHYIRQARFFGELDPWEDVFALGDSCALVITQSMSSISASAAAKSATAGSGSPDDNNAPQMIICYDLVPRED